MDGLEATRLLREQLTGARRPTIIAVTADPPADDDQWHVAAGMDQVLTKPVEVHRLAQMCSNSARVGEPPALVRFRTDFSRRAGEPTEIELRYLRPMSRAKCWSTACLMNFGFGPSRRVEQPPGIRAARRLDLLRRAGLGGGCPEDRAQSNAREPGNPGGRTDTFNVSRHPRARGQWRSPRAVGGSRKGTPSSCAPALWPRSAWQAALRRPRGGSALRTRLAEFLRQRHDLIVVAVDHERRHAPGRKYADTAIGLSSSSRAASCSAVSPYAGAAFSKPGYVRRSKTG